MTSKTLDPAAVPAYIATRPALRDLVDTDSLQVEEVGDGNLNQVFICTDSEGRRVVVKQALPYVRLVGPDWPMTEDRAAREANALTVHLGLSPEYTCRLLDYDPELHTLALEDLSDHEVLRTRLNNGGPHAGIAEAMGRYVADYGFGTSYFALGEETFRLRAAEAANTELCALTEDVVFTEPFRGAERNSYTDGVAPVIEGLQADDAEWLAAAMQMKRRFITRQESLLHGDLHTGSIFVRGDGDSLSCKAFDSEFAFYGPLGYDLGLFWSNLLAAAVRATVLGDKQRASSLLEAIPVSWRVFEARMRELWPTRTTAAKHPDVCLDQWLGDVLDDSWGFAGCESTRRCVGIAKVSDIESLEGEQHTTAITHVLTLARQMLVERSQRSIDDHVASFRSALDLA